MLIRNLEIEANAREDIEPGRIDLIVAEVDRAELRELDIGRNDARSRVCQRAIMQIERLEIREIVARQKREKPFIAQAGADDRKVRQALGTRIVRQNFAEFVRERGAIQR